MSPTNPGQCWACELACFLCTALRVSPTKSIFDLPFPQDCAGSICPWKEGYAGMARTARHNLIAPPIECFGCSLIVRRSELKASL
eukprot:scaffold27875_cov18-Tisochrysis_lutea.AAC.2